MSVVTPTGYVVGFVFDSRESRVMLILKARPAWQRGSLNGIGGHIKALETPAEAMRRETAEEAPLLGAVEWDLFAQLRGDRPDPFVLYCFRTVVDQEHLMASVRECGSAGESLLLASVSDLPPNVLPNLRWLVPMARVQQAPDWPYSVLCP